MASQASDSSKPRLRTSASDELAIIAQRAQAFTNASGSAIALGEGNADEIVCRARSGSSAPDVGVSLRVEGSFTGICIQTGKELRCDDAETDTRVDGAAIRALGIRSMVVTPVKEESKVVGVLAVFAPTPHAFTITHVAVLKTMADQITALLMKERRAREESAYVEPQVTAPKPPVAASAPLAPVVIKPSSTNSSGAAAATAPARVTPIASKMESKVEIKTEAKTESKPEAKVESFKPPVQEVAAPVPFPRREEKRHEHKAEPATKHSFGTFDAVAEDHKESSGNKFMLIGAAIVLIAVVGVSWLLLRKGKTEPVASASSAPAVSQPAAPATGNSAANAPATSTPVSQPAATQNSKPAVEKADSRKPETPARNENKQTAANTPAPAPATVSLSSGPSRINRGSAQQTQSADVAPSLSASGGNANSLSALASPANNSKVAMMAPSELVNAEVVRRVAAVYPDIAKARRITGTVDIRVKVGKDGKVSNPQFLNGPVIFRDAAFDAVRQWQYKPATLNGQPIEQEQEIKMNFHP
jgi:TonB family protein